MVYSANTGVSHLAGQLDPVAYNIVRTETQRMMDERTGSKIYFGGIKKSSSTDFVRKTRIEMGGDRVVIEIFLIFETPTLW